MQELWIRSSTCRTVFQLVHVDSRKRRGHASGIRHAHPRAPLSSESLRVGSYRDRARARHSTSARDCACVRTCDRPTQFRRDLSDANVSAGFVYRTPVLRDRPAHRRPGHGRACGVPAASDLANRHHPAVAPASLGAGREHRLALLQPQSRACPVPGRLRREPGISPVWQAVNTRPGERRKATVSRCRGKGPQRHRGRPPIARGGYHRACTTALSRGPVRCR